MVIKNINLETVCGITSVLPENDKPEIAFADLEDDMILAESMLKYVINYVLENAPEEMNFGNTGKNADDQLL